MTSNRPAVAVLGMGAWGSAIALHCATKGLSVVGWNRTSADVSRIYDERGLRVGGVYYPRPPSLTVTSDINDLQNAELLFIALPARAWCEVVPSLQAKILVSATKGLEPSSGLTPLTYLHEKLGRPRESIGVISGPSFASDLASQRPLSVVAASFSQETASKIAETFSGPSARVYTSSDPLGVEIGGIFKNVVAIAAGVSDALGFGPSARAGIISRGLAEMIRLATAMGVDPRTLTGLSGLGDLIMTATEDQSRNRTVGLRLGRGESLQHIEEALGGTAEGVHTTPLVKRLAAQFGVDVPITDNVALLLSGVQTPRELAAAIMKRPQKSEF